MVTTEKRERRKSSSSSTHSTRQEKRPPSAHKNHGFPKLHIPHLSHHTKKEDPSYFGVATPTSATRHGHVPAIVSQPNMTQPTQPTQPIPMRPRAVTSQTYPPRPVSYHAAYTASGAYGPPLSSSAWANYQPHHLQPQPQPVITPSYPPPQTPGYMRYATPAPPASDYFASQAMSAPERPMSARPLASRFDPPSRTSSGFGNRAVQQDIDDAYSAGFSGYYDDGYTSASEGVARKRESIRVPSGIGQRMSKQEMDFHAMPPPPRPILRRPVTDYPQASVDSYRDGRTLIRDDSRPRQSSSHRNSVSYDLGDGPERVRVETANAGRRRQSYYGQTATASTGSSDYEAKIRQAATYQQDVGETVPLTAEVLKRQQRRQAGSSRSTKSSASRDESDWRKSATTRTTRSGSGEGENVTIKVTGTARVMVGGAQIDCPDGGEIEIKQQQQQQHQRAIRNGSERSSEYGGPQRIDDRDHRSRNDRPSGRTRTSSRHSYSRSKQYYGESQDNNWL